MDERNASTHLIGALGLLSVLAALTLFGAFAWAGSPEDGAARAEGASIATGSMASGAMAGSHVSGSMTAGPGHRHGGATTGGVTTGGVTTAEAIAAQGVPARHIGPQGRVGQFVVACRYSHSATDDPIVHFGHPGRSHRHDFYGSTATDASSTAEQLLDTPTTCDKSVDTAAYWQPTLFDNGVAVEPSEVQAYYRAAPGVDPADLQPFPLGLELLAGDPTATTAQTGEAAGWVCGSSTTLSASPPECSGRAPLHMLLTFPDCWDGERLATEDHRSHAAYSADGSCPDDHPVHLPQLTVSVRFPIGGPGHQLTLASGNTFSAHGDFLNAWEPAGLQREIDHCLKRDVVCDLGSNRQEEGPFFHQ